MDRQWKDKIFEVSAGGFESLAVELFCFQYRQNAIYRSYVDALGIDPGAVSAVASIPFLPIRFFKSHDVVTTRFEPQQVFESSGTTGMTNSRHAIRDLSIYRQSFLTSFHHFYGQPSDWCIIALLPSYIERGNSSLVFMADALIRESGHPQSGFYLHDYDLLADRLAQLESVGQRTLLLGVTFALLDFTERYPLPLRHTTIMETGGMKGRREELVRTDIHNRLKAGFGLPSIHSEYGMTELLSQAYSEGDGIFQAPLWMRVLARDEEDPFDIRQPFAGFGGTVTGALNVVDLANVYSCAFIATDDAARIHPDGSFEILGRLDNSDLRGCSLMVI